MKAVFMLVSVNAFSKSLKLNSQLMITDDWYTARSVLQVYCFCGRDWSTRRSRSRRDGSTESPVTACGQPPKVKIKDLM